MSPPFFQHETKEMPMATNSVREHYLSGDIDATEMDLIDFFAGLALQAEIVKGICPRLERAESAYDYAKEMLIERRIVIEKMSN